MEEIHTKALKLAKSCAIYYSTFAYGCAYTFLAPAVVALARNFQTDVSHISLVFTILTITYLTSALLCGFLFNLIKNRSVMLMALLSLIAIPLFIIPHVSNLTAFFILGGFFGAGCGGYDVGQVAGIIEIWRGEAAVYILIQHFAYSLGTILPTLILHPFLPDTVGIFTSDSHSHSVQYQLDDQSSGSGSDRSSNLVVPFTIAGFITALGIFVHLQIYLRTRYLSWTCGLVDRMNAQSFTPEVANFDPPPPRIFHVIPRNQASVNLNDAESPIPMRSQNHQNPGHPVIDMNLDMTLTLPSSSGQGQASRTRGKGKDKDNDHNNADGDDENWYATICQCWDRVRSGSKCDRRTVLLTLLSCAVIGPYRGMELTTMQFLPTFSVFSDVHLSEAEGSSVLFSMNSAYALGRGLGILLVLKLPPEFILLGNFILVLLANLILLLAGQTMVNYLWVGSICLGAGLSTIFPAYYSFIERFFFVSHSVVSVITVSDGILASIYPLVVGHSVERTPAVLTWVNFFSMTVLFIAFGITFYVAKIRRI